MKNRLLVLLLVMWFFTNCTEEIAIDSFEALKEVVVEASFTDELKIQQIELYYTGGLDGSGVELIRGASVKVLDEEGNEINFQEQFDGVYRTERPVAGRAGIAYHLYFELSDGRQFESIPQRMPELVEIDAIQAELVQLAPDENNEIRDGALFSAIIPNEAGKTSFLRFGWQDARRVVVPYPSRFTGSTANREIVPRPSPLDTCYTQAFSDRFVLKQQIGDDTGNGTAVEVNAYALEELTYADAYVLKMDVYALSADAFDFYQRLRRVTENSGALFDTQQGEIFGNIKSVDNENDFTLGFFEVAAFNTRSQFFDLNELRSQAAIPSDFDRLCPSTDFFAWESSLTEFYEAADAGGDALEIGRRASYRVYDFDDGITYLRFAQCTDCRFFGERPQPVFWIDE